MPAQRISCILSFCLVSLTGASNAQHVFRSDLYIGANFSAGPYLLRMQSGPLNLKPRGLNHTFGYTARLHPAGKPLFLQTGVRLRYAQSEAIAVNTVPGFVRAELRWRVRHESVSVPLHIGRTVTLGSRHAVRIEPYAGMSFGVCGPSLIGQSASTITETSDTVGLGSVTSNDQFGKRFLATADLGATIIPFPRHPKFGAGVDLSLNLTPTPNYSAEGFIANQTQGVYQPYGFAFARRYMNASVSLHYSFGRKWKRSVQSPPRKRIQQAEPLDD